MKVKRTFLFSKNHKVGSDLEAFNILKKTGPVQKTVTTYIGRRDNGNAIVTVHDRDQPQGHQPRPLPERQDLKNHSPNGFEWGYGGSGPAQLALALLADHLGNDEQALALYQEFKFRVVAGLPFQCWKLTSEDIDKALKRITASV